MVQMNTASELAEAIEGLIGVGDSERAAFFRDRPRPEDLAETLAAFANRSGGLIVAGVGGRAQRKAEGVDDPERIAALVNEAALALTPPLLLGLPQQVVVAGHTLVCATVPPGLPHVYSVAGRYLRREGPTNAPLSAHQLRQLLLERGDAGWDRVVPEDVRLDDLDTQKIEHYVERIGTAAADDPLLWLFRRGCLDRRGNRYVPTNAGVLLFGRHVEHWLPQCEITLVRYRGLEMSDEWEREDIRDTLPEQVRRAQTWIVEHMRKGSRMVGLEREDWTEYPEAAVREILVNAVAHRDYAVRGEGIRISLFADRLECYSPGRLPGHVTIDNIATERFSRNEVLVQALSDLRLIERLGYGIDRVVKQMASAGLPSPSFRETAAGFVVTLQGRAVADARAIGVDTAAWRRQGINERQIAALLYLAEQQRITNREYRELQPDISDETVRRDLADLVERGLLLRIGDRRGTYYILR